MFRQADPAGADRIDRIQILFYLVISDDRLDQKLRRTAADFIGNRGIIHDTSEVGDIAVFILLDVADHIGFSKRRRRIHIHVLFTDPAQQRTVFLNRRVTVIKPGDHPDKGHALSVILFRNRILRLFGKLLQEGSLPAVFAELFKRVVHLERNRVIFKDPAVADQLSAPFDHFLPALPLRKALEQFKTARGRLGSVFGVADFLFESGECLFRIASQHQDALSSGVVSLASRQHIIDIQRLQRLLAYRLQFRIIREALQGILRDFIGGMIIHRIDAAVQIPDDLFLYFILQVLIRTFAFSKQHKAHGR